MQCDVLRASDISRRGQLWTGRRSRGCSPGGFRVRQSRGDLLLAEQRERWGKTAQTKEQLPRLDVQDPLAARVSSPVRHRKRQHGRERHPKNAHCPAEAAAVYFSRVEYAEVVARKSAAGQPA